MKFLLSSPFLPALALAAALVVTPFWSVPDAPGWMGATGEAGTGVGEATGEAGTGVGEATGEAGTVVQFSSTAVDENHVRIARVQYRGGGDWYNDPSALTNLIDFAVQQVPLPLDRSYDDVSIGSRDLHRYPFVFMTGHGNIDVNATEAANMRDYLDKGGFLYIDDDYGFDPYIRPVIERIFPDEDLVELPASYPLFNNVFDFPEGLPKIHEHDGKPPQGFGIFRDGRLVLFYTYESNLADGWAYDVHDNPAHLTEQALQMGVNLLVYAFTR